MGNIKIVIAFLTFFVLGMVFISAYDSENFLDYSDDIEKTSSDSNLSIEKDNSHKFSFLGNFLRNLFSRFGANKDLEVTGQASLDEEKEEDKRMQEQEKSLKELEEEIRSLKEIIFRLEEIVNQTVINLENKTNQENNTKIIEKTEVIREVVIVEKEEPTTPTVPCWPKQGNVCGIASA